MTSKIPPAEWDAIAARRDKGESVAYIARTYETSPATIYGILKKVAEAKGSEAPAPQPAAEAVAAPEPAPVTAPTPAPTPAPAPVPAAAPAPTRLTLSASRPQTPPPAATQPVVQPAAPAPAPTPAAERAPAPAAQAPQAPQQPQQPFRFTYENRAVEPPPRQPRSPAPPRPFADVEPKTALTANLDQELRAQADTAILAFQAAFQTVLSDETATTRKELRQAASDLMRVAARTTIALERKDALIDRAAMPAMHRPRNDPPNEPGDYRHGRRPPRG